VRIAAHRSAITTSASAPETNAKSAGASFLEVLADTSAQSSNVSAAAVSGVAQRSSSDTAGQKQQPQSNLAGKSQETDQPLNAVNQSAIQTAAAKAASSPTATALNASAPARAAARDEKPAASSPASTAQIALVAAALPAEIAPVSTPRIPSPTAANRGADAHALQPSASVDALAALQPQSAGSAATRSAHAAVGVLSPLTEQDAKTNGSSATTADAASQSDPSADASPNSSSAAAASSATSPAQQSAAALVQGSAILAIPAALPGLANAAPANRIADQSQSRSAATASAATGSNQSSGSASAHSTQSDVQAGSAAQHGQSQTAAPSAQAQPNSAAPQVQSVVAPHAVAQAASAPHTHADSAEPAHAAAQSAPAEAGEAAPAQAINTANVIQRMNETEMRVGLHSAEFGDISIRTSVSQQQMMAQISVDHSDLGKAISAHIPAMEAKLGGDFGIRAMVQVNQSGMSFSGERGYSPQRDQRSYAQPAQAEPVPALRETDTAVLRAAAAPGNGYRLDIQA